MCPHSIFSSRATLPAGCTICSHWAILGKAVGVILPTKHKRAISSGKRSLSHQCNSWSSTTHKPKLKEKKKDVYKTVANVLLKQPRADFLHWGLQAFSSEFFNSLKYDGFVILNRCTDFGSVKEEPAKWLFTPSQAQTDPILDGFIALIMSRKLYHHNTQLCVCPAI